MPNGFAGPFRAAWPHTRPFSPARHAPLNNECLLQSSSEASRYCPSVGASERQGHDKTAASARHNFAVRFAAMAACDLPYQRKPKPVPVELPAPVGR